MPTLYRTYIQYNAASEYTQQHVLPLRIPVTQVGYRIVTPNSSVVNLRDLRCPTSRPWNLVEGHGIVWNIMESYRRFWKDWT